MGPLGLEMGTYNCIHWDHLNLFYTGDIIFAMGSESELKLAKIKKLSSQNHFKIRSHYCLLPRLVRTRTFVCFQIKPNSDTLTKFLLHTLYSLSNQECWFYCLFTFLFISKPLLLLPLLPDMHNYFLFFMEDSWL